MPVKSQAQRRFMYATEEGKTDAPPSVGKDFIDASHGIKGLPEHVGEKKHGSFTKAMRHHGVAKSDDHKRHPATGSYNMGTHGNKFGKR